MTRDEHLDELLGAYALDAVDDEERRRVERYLAANPEARAQVWEMRQAAAMIAHSGDPAPEGVWDRIVAAMEERSPAFTALKRSRLNTGRILAAAAVLLAAVGGFVIAVVVDDNGQRDATAAIERAYDAARADPEWRRLQLRSDDGSLAADAVLRGDGVGLISAGELPALPVDETYQLWGVYASGDVISLGVIGNRPGVEPFAAAGPLDALAITREVAGGVVTSSNEPLLVGSLEQA